MIALGQACISSSDKRSAAFLLSHPNNISVLSKSGQGTQFTLKLGRAPSDDVHVALSVDQPYLTVGENITGAATMTFTKTNWNQEVVINVTEGDSTGLSIGDHEAHISFGITTTDPAYSALTVPPLMAILSVRDNVILSVAPSVTSTTPEDNAADVYYRTDIEVTFTEPIDVTTLNNGFTLVSDTSNVQFIATTDDNNVIFTPISPLSFGKQYMATLNTSIADLTGEHLAEPMSWKFTVGQQPTLTSMTPTENAIAVSVGTTVQMNFSTAMDTDSLQRAFTLTQNNQAVAGTWQFVDKQATFIPTASLDFHKIYVATLSDAATDVHGNPVAATTRTFTTITDPRLASLSLSTGTLSPTFNSAVFSYSASIPFGNGQVTIQAAAIDSSSVLTFNSSSSPIVNLNPGANVITLLSTALDGAQQSYTLTINTLIFGQQAFFKTPTAAVDNNLGFTVAISGDTMAAAAYRENSNTGAVYIFVRNGTTWTQQARIVPDNARIDDQFGFALALFGDTLAIGSVVDSAEHTITNGALAPLAGSDTDATDAGAVYVYLRNGTTWTEQAYIKSSNSAATDLFGTAVALYDNTLVVGAQVKERAYVFVRNGAEWMQQAEISPAFNVSGDNFGVAVAVDHDTAVIGATGEDSNSGLINGTGTSNDNSLSFSGAAYVYTRSGTDWTQQAFLKAANPDLDDTFGASVEVEGDTVVIGAYGESSRAGIVNGSTASTDNSAINAGAVYVYTRSGTTWTQQAFLKAANADAGDFFGNALGLSGNLLVVGAPYESSNVSSSTANVVNGSTASTNNSLQSSGAAYVFYRTGTNWAETAFLKADHPNADDKFGYSVGISGSSIVVGDVGESSNLTGVHATGSSDTSVTKNGAAYVFSWPP
jgi:trimeric autotransporter adhesin